MGGRSRPDVGAEDRLARAVVAGFAAATALLAVYVLVYVLAALFASLEPTNRASAQQMSGWFGALTTSPLLDLRQNPVYALVAMQVILALAGAVAYASLQPRSSGPSAVKGPLVALPLWLITLTVLLPLSGGGVFGLELGAGPLPMLGALVAYLAYGAVLGPVYGSAGDFLLGPATADEALARRRTTRTCASGLALGLLAGALVGLPLVWSLGWPEQGTMLGLPPAALALALVLVGGALGLQVGSLAGLPTAALAASAPSVQPVMATAAAPATQRPSVARLRVVAVNGVCPQGYGLGDTFTCGPDGHLRPALCPAAAGALPPLLAAMVRGQPDAPRRVACPIYDHMLVRESQGGAAGAA